MRIAKNNDVIRLQESMGRMNFYRLFRYWSHNSSYFVSSPCRFPSRVSFNQSLKLPLFHELGPSFAIPAEDLLEPPSLSLPRCPRHLTLFPSIHCQDCQLLVRELMQLLREVHRPLPALVLAGGGYSPTSAEVNEAPKSKDMIISAVWTHSNWKEPLVFADARSPRCFRHVHQGTSSRPIWV